MAPLKSSNPNNPFESLATCVAKGNENVDLKKLSKLALQVLVSSDSLSTSNSMSELDEQTLLENIKCQIRLVNSDKHATIFENVHKKLSRLEMNTTTRLDILKFLLKLSEFSARRIQNANVNVFHTNRLNINDSIQMIYNSTMGTTPSSYPESSYTNIGSSYTNIGSNTSISTVVSSQINSTSIPNSKDNNSSTNRKPWKISSSVSKISSPSRNSSQQQLYDSSISRVSVSEQEIIQDLIFCLQGIEGKYIKSDGQHGFKLDSKVHVEKRSIVLNAMELGYLYNTISSYANLSKHKGFVRQGLVCALRDELATYYHSLSLIHAQTSSLPPRTSSQTPSSPNTFIDSPLSEVGHTLPSNTRGLPPSFSLIRLMTWAKTQISRFQCLSDVLAATDGLTGGALISSVARFVHVGHLDLQRCVTGLLSAMTRPFFLLISQWMVEGTLRDPHGEFFVCEDSHLNSSYVWDGKYRLSESKIPSFMSKLTAEHILRAGICINFLQSICNEKTPLGGSRKALRDLENNSGDLLSMVRPCNQLSALIEQTYAENSKMVLNVLVTKFGLYEHLQGLRRYMLLGQGDFIHCLMKLLIAELNKPASHLHSAYLHEVLDAAIRGTNAQYDTKDVLTRLTIKTLVVSSKDLGWDIFVLDYNLNGPLEQILRVKDSPYSTTFKFLWSMKRLDYILSMIWEKQVFATKQLRKLTELSALLKQGSGLISEMVHFSHQFQYYISFEVVETAWQKFDSLVHAATSLRTVIEEHKHFLRSILEGTMQDEKSKHFKFHLASITRCILELKSLQESFIMSCEKELKRRTDLETKIEEYGTNEEEQKRHERYLAKFRAKLIPDMKAQYTTITKSYHSTLNKFLLDLSTHPNVALKLLANRFDFNEHYQRSHSELSECVKFRRTSDYNTSIGSTLDRSGNTLDTSVIGDSLNRTGPGL
uniref:Gamma-tubulin complex component 3 n=1 Tax=Cacopsylla melanoneura TaxID=428564 RepID=A0A8D8YC24_9HEMI